MTTAVDTNVLIALLYDETYADSSENALREAYREGRVVITPIVYAELAADGHFEDDNALDTFLRELGIDVVTPSQAALFSAGKAFDRYTTRRPTGLQCPSCGTQQTVTCSTCGEALTPRQHIAADFLIGGHALVDAESLISFDTNFYQTYFPSLTVVPNE